MFDFTLRTYIQIIEAFKRVGYKVITLEKFFSSQNNIKKFVILRHDVDKSPEKALKMALIEWKINVRSSYYFRSVKKSYERDC